MSNLQLSWHAERQPDGSFRYCGKLNDNSPGCQNGRILGSVIGRKTLDANSQRIIPGMALSGGGDQASDSTRCRCDALGECICNGMIMTE
jgi:hypothetical protein